VQNVYESVIFMLGERLKGLEQWREERTEWEEKETNKMFAMEKAREEMVEDINSLKRGRTDAYSQIGILKEDIGRIWERMRVLEYISKNNQSKDNEDD